MKLFKSFIIKFFFLKIFCFFYNFQIFLLVESNSTSKFFLSFFIISRVDFPIEPVEPSIAIFIFIFIKLHRSNKQQEK